MALMGLQASSSVALSGPKECTLQGVIHHCIEAVQESTHNASRTHPRRPT